MRPSKDEWAMQLAVDTAKRATCLRRQVGCVLVDVRGHILSTGYNGVAAGLPHCNEVETVTFSNFDMGIYGQDINGKKVTLPHACVGATSPSGTNLDACQAIHAEQNALLQCRDVYQIDTCYVTTSPCVTCVKLLLNTGCSRIVFLEEYPHAEAAAMWKGVGRVWTAFNEWGE